MQSILEFGVRLIVALQGLGAWPTLPMQFFSFLGTEDFFMLALPILYWCVDSMLGIRVAIILLLSTNINAAFKLAFHGPRPYWYSPKVRRPGYRDILRRPIRPCPNCCCYMGSPGGLPAKMVGLAGRRPAHFIDRTFAPVSGRPLSTRCVARLVDRWPDPVAGAALLGSGDCLGKKTERWLAGSHRLSGLAGGVPAAAHSLHLVESHELAAATGLGHVRNTGPFIADVATVAGTFFGMLVGLVWLAGQGGFQTKGLWWKLVLRYLLGVAGVLIIRYGLKFIFPSWRDRSGLLLRLSALHGDWFLGNRWGAMDIYSG